MVLALLALPVHADTMVGPLYSEHAHSYFGLVQVSPGAVVWDKARELAREQYFKNTRGRLAIIRDKQTHEFIVDTFAKSFRQQAFIGLRYWCKVMRLQWVDGTSPPDNGFAPWNQPWYRTANETCFNPGAAGAGFMGVHYEWPAESSSGALVLRAAADAKRFSFYLVEFPTGKP
jgi:hypothetical protein